MKVALYLKVRGNASYPEAQMDKLFSFAGSRGLEVVETIIDIKMITNLGQPFSSNGGWKRLQAALEERKVSGVVVLAEQHGLAAVAFGCRLLVFNGE